MYLDKLTNDYSKMCMAAYCADFDLFMSYYDVDKLVEFELELDNQFMRGYVDDYPQLVDDPLSDDDSESYPWSDIPPWSDRLLLAVIYDRLDDKYNPNKLNNVHLLTYILAYSCRHNFIFAYQLRHSGLELNDLVYEAISASFIQHGYLDDYFIKVYKPLCIWYPKHPSKETCLKLLKVHEFYMYSVAYLAIIMDWEDIFVKCNIYCGFKDMYAFACYFRRDTIKQRLEKFPIIFANVYSRSKIYTEYNHGNNLWVSRYFVDFYINQSYGSSLSDGLFDHYSNHSYSHIQPNIGNVVDLNLDYKILKSNIQLPMGKKLPFNLSNKYVAYIGDIQYYQGGDFEYAKWGALNNSIFANYVINNKDKFPDFVIRNAVSNMIINGAIDDELVVKYKPFYFYNFQNIYMFDRTSDSGFTPDPEFSDCYRYGDYLLKKFPFLKANIAFGFLQDFEYFSRVDVHEYPEIKTDIDIISIILSKDCVYTCIDKHIKQAEEQGYYYKHLDFENECNYDEPKKIPFDSVNLDEWKNKPFKTFKEGLNITELASITTSDPASLTDFSKLQI